MTERDLQIPEQVNWSQAAVRIERAAADAGLRIAMKGSLRAYPGSVHWHLKSGRETGTLELTIWPAKGKAWFSVQSGRRAKWIDEELVKLIKAMEAARR